MGGSAVLWVEDNYMVNTSMLVGCHGKPMSLPPARIPRGMTFGTLLTFYNSTPDYEIGLSPSVAYILRYCYWMNKTY